MGRHITDNKMDKMDKSALSGLDQLRKTFH